MAVVNQGMLLILLSVCVTVTLSSTLPLGMADHQAVQKLERMKRAQPAGINHLVYFVQSGVRVQKPSLLQRVKRQLMDEEKPEIKELKVYSTITDRFATTVVNMSLVNPSEEDKEATFEMWLPNEAFMANFSMMIDGVWRQTEVVSKEEAEKRYEEARERNETAGQVATDYNPAERIPKLEKFKISVNVAGKSKIKFTLTYLELLRRVDGRYEQRISIRPNQVIEDLLIVIDLFDQQGIKDDVKVTEPIGSNSVVNMDTTISKNGEIVHIEYRPTVERQTSMSKDKQVGLYGDLIVSYDVIHEGDPAGEILVSNGFFVHFFSPLNKKENYTEVLPKNIIFVIDISGSMGGTKIEKTREALPVILDQLNPQDKFMLILFDDKTEYWPNNRHLVAAHGDNIKQAKRYVDEYVHADGGTNIYDALMEALAKLDVESYTTGSKIIVFLTDGDPTAGRVTDTNEIIKDFQMENSGSGGSAALFSLGFGFNMNFDFLGRISYLNNGMARRIYDDIDADKQLKDFVKEINNPVLYNVQVKYTPKISVTLVNFPQLFLGSELVFAGKFLEEEPKEWDCGVTAVGPNNKLIDLSKHIISGETMVIPPEAREIYQPRMVERLYIYMKIKDLLIEALMANPGSDEETQLKQLGLNLSIEYHLVTPLTSFLIVQDKPDDMMFQEDSKMAMYPMAGSSYSDATEMKSLGLYLMLIVTGLVLKMVQ